MSHGLDVFQHVSRNVETRDRRPDWLHMSWVRFPGRVCRWSENSKSCRVRATQGDFSAQGLMGSVLCNKVAMGQNLWCHMWVVIHIHKSHLFWCSRTVPGFWPIAIYIYIYIYLHIFYVTSLGQWQFRDPKMGVPLFRPYFVGICPEIQAIFCRSNESGPEMVSEIAEV